MAQVVVEWLDQYPIEHIPYIANLQILFIKVFIIQTCPWGIVPRPCLPQLRGEGKEGAYDHHQQTKEYAHAETNVQTDGESCYEDHQPHTLGERKEDERK